MTLQSYHLKYQSRTDSEIAQRIKAKETELAQIFQSIPTTFAANPIRIAVLGCIDKRYISAHKIIFEKILQKSAIVITFDITTEHLQGAEGVVQHDCTLPLPNPPYEITFGHLLLKFIETEKQWDVLKNSYNALSSDGLAIHILDPEDYQTSGILLPGGGFTVPLQRWEEKLTAEQIPHQKLLIKSGLNLDMDCLALLLFKH